MDKVEREAVEEVLVPIQAGELDLYVAAVPMNFAEFDMGIETEIAARQRSLKEALESISAIARQASQSLSSTNASKITVELGCEFALESGGALVAIVGKAGAKSSFKVCLEWTKPSQS